MLTRLALQNFKSWPAADIAFGRITGLFGTNSSGKSSLTQLLLLLKQTRDASDRSTALDLNGSLVELGTMADVIHDHDLTRSIRFDLGFEHPSEFRITDPSAGKKGAIAQGSDLSVHAEIDIHRQAPRSQSLVYKVGNAKFSLKALSREASKFELHASVPDRGSFRFIRTPGRAWKLPGPVKTYQFPDQARTYFQNAGFLSDFEAAFEAALDRLFYLGPLRDYPKRDYLWAQSHPTDVGGKGQRAIDAIIAAQGAGRMLNLRRKGHKMAFPAVVAHWLKEMGLIDAFHVTEIAQGSNRWQAKVKTARGGAEVLLTDVGFGVSQVLPVITLLYYVPEGSTVILEQPEIHLHPLAQAELADLIIQAATHRKVQVLLESHSEHLLLRLQRRIAEKKLSADDVKLYFCNASAGVSKIEPLDLDLCGNIENWPDRFMGDAFGEAAAAEMARLKRMKAPG